MSSQELPEDENAPSKMDYYIATLAAGGLGVVLAGPWAERLLPAVLQVISGACFLVGLHRSCITHLEVLRLCRQAARTSERAHAMSGRAMEVSGGAEALGDPVRALRDRAEAILDNTSGPSDEARAAASAVASHASDVASAQDRAAALRRQAAAMLDSAKEVECQASVVRNSSASGRVWALSFGATLLLLARFFDHRVFW